MIETVAGAALAGTVLTGMILARGRLDKQRASLLRRESAVAAADRLLAQWWSAPAAFPRRGSGPLAGDGLAWRVVPLPDPVAEKLGTSKVAFEIIDASAGDDVVLRLEMLLPPPPASSSP